ncbi:hypothetical protein PR002_g31759 [Phytophthora rubi]|uniref:Uncharacterized protein n=1 Tax=Phytophthora rubi TaxID=129364 RepID=A0A6A3GDD2_9STRA|nr:hypothetical protein PR002_g31759 [Phytophthora rubi]
MVAGTVVVIAAGDVDVVWAVVGDAGRRKDESCRGLPIEGTIWSCLTSVDAACKASADRVMDAGRPVTVTGC